MGMTIQFESLVELGAIYLMEHDPNVFAYYDQPYTFKLRYLNKTGKKMQGHYYTPDFLVLRTTGAVLEEWKTAEELQKLSEKQPYRYQKTEEGSWRSPPSEELAQEGNHSKTGVETPFQYRWGNLRPFSNSKPHAENA
jgi:putative transposase